MSRNRSFWNILQLLRLTIDFELSKIENKTIKWLKWPNIYRLYHCSESKWATHFMSPVMLRHLYVTKKRKREFFFKTFYLPHSLPHFSTAVARSHRLWLIGAQSVCLHLGGFVKTVYLWTPQNSFGCFFPVSHHQ